MVSHEFKPGNFSTSPSFTQNQTGETPLHIAVAQKNMAFAQRLIERHAQMNLRTSDGSSALDLAAQHGDEKMVALLLEAGAEINPTNKNAKLPLHSAILGKNRQIVEALLDRGAHINAPDSGGQTGPRRRILFHS